jgi:hypothetical protein
MFQPTRSVVVLLLSLLLGGAVVLAQTDPGVRGGAAGAGGPLASRKQRAGRKVF